MSLFWSVVSLSIVPLFFNSEIPCVFLNFIFGWVAFSMFDFLKYVGVLSANDFNVKTNLCYQLNV